MGKARTDPRIEARVCELRRRGLSLNELVAETGVAKGTIRDILKRNGVADNRTPSEKHTRTPAPATDGDGAESNRTPNRTQTDGLSGLSQEMIAHDLVTFIAASKRGINEIRKASDKEYRELRDRKQTEAQWMHLYGMGIKIGVKATGLSAESLMQAVDDYEIDVADALERFNSRHR